MIQKITLKYTVIASFIIGIMLTISFGVYGYSYYEIYKNRVPIEGYVENVDYDEGITQISYSTGDITVKKKIHIIDSGIEEGSYITVYYDENNPENSFIAEQVYTILFFFCVGIFFLIIFAITYIVYKKKNQKKSMEKKHKNKM